MLLSLAQAKAPLTLEADQQYLQRQNADAAKRALQLYRKLNTAHPRNSEISWKTAMAYYYVGQHYAKDPDEEKSMYGTGEEVARLGLLKDDRCAACYFWAAVNLVLWAEKAGKFQLILAIHKVQKDLKKVIELDDRYAFGGAYRTLGQLEAGLPGFLGGSDARAVEYLEKAIRVSPTSPINYLYLSRIYLERFKDQSKALEAAKKGLALPPPPASDIENLSAIKDLRQIVAEAEPAARPNP